MIIAEYNKTKTYTSVAVTALRRKSAKNVNYYAENKGYLRASQR